jgi:serine/threonine protein kinase
LTPERWAQIEELFHRAAECAPKDRAGILEGACTGDPELRREVEGLLTCDGAAGDSVQVAVHSELTAVAYPLTGETLSHYRILDGVGGGGMGLVYRAEDIRLGRQVALKFLPEESVKDPAALGRFEREARSASALEHPNICPIYEFGEHEGQPFLVMQLLEGQTLRELISAAGQGKPPLELSKLLDLAVQITDGLDAAHRQGIIHRDIKPANIFVTCEGQAKILDFGLAKLARVSAGPGADSERDPSGDGRSERTPRESETQVIPDPFLSRTGVAMGTAGYMSPEQVRGEKLDARTDLFSFGLVLYEMATGKRAFAGDTGPALQKAILNQVPSPARELNPEVSAKLEKIIDRALEKDREARYQVAADIRADLRSLRQATEPRYVIRKRVMVGGVAAALLIGSAILWFGRVRSPSGQSPPELKLRQLTNNSFENRVQFGAISPDGKYLAYSDANGIRIQLVATSETRVIPQPKELDGKEVSWEIPGTWLPESTVFVANAHPASESPGSWSSQTSSVWLVSVPERGAPRKLRDNALAYSVSPDGTLISFGTNKGKLGDREIWLMGPGGENAHKLFDTDEQSSIGGLSWSPDGKRVLYYKTDQFGDTLLSRDLQNGPPFTLFRPTEMKRLNDILWLADGRLLYSVSEPESFFGSACNFWEMQLDRRTGKPIEKPRQLTNWSGFCMSALSETSNGKNLAFLKWAGKETSSVADLTEGGTRILSQKHFPLSESSEGAVGWTPDSKGIFFVSNRSGHGGIYRQSLNEDIAEPVVIEGYGRNLCVSPGGKSLLYLGRTENGAPPTKGPQAVMRVPVTGGTRQRLFTARTNSLMACPWSTSGQCVIAEPTDDGKQLIFTAIDPTEGRGRELFRFALIPNDENWYLAISPDGTRLAVTQTQVGPMYILSLAGKAQTQFRVKGWTNLESFFWAADGNGLFVTAGVHNGKDILHVDLQGNAHLLWENSGGSGETEARPSPDGRHLAFSGWTTSGNMWLMENF